MDWLYFVCVKSAELTPVTHGKSILSDLQANKDAFHSLYFIAVAFLGAFGIYFVRRRTRSMEESSAVATKQFELSELTRINDQYVRSVDQLGNDRTEVRLGGLYGLIHVAEASKEFQTQVVELLAAYIRKNATEAKLTTADGAGRVEEVQAALNILGRVYVGHTPAINLKDAYLKNCVLHGYFAGIDFSGATMIGVDCSQADLSDSLLIGVKLGNSTCVETNFTNADITNAHFTSRATCAGANFYGAICVGANFINADCSRTCFSHAKMDNANFRKTDCTKADFSYLHGDGDNWKVRFTDVETAGIVTDGTNTKHIEM